MDDFYFYACVIALIVLIVLLTLIGIAISKANELIIYPPTFKNCPDYWTEGDGTPGNALPGYCLYPTNKDYRNRGSTEFIDSTNATLPSAIDRGNLHSLSFMAYNSAGTRLTTDTVVNATDLTSGTTDTSKVAKFYIKMNENDDSWNTIYGNAYAGKTARCAKRQWAIENEFSWDGISNYNGCT